jgi:5-methylcytosine-specific restriction endonuclease McrA
MEHHCNTCEMSFKSNKCLQQHMKCRRHINKLDRRNPLPSFACDDCGKKYYHRQSLYTHRNTCVPMQQNEPQITETISKKDHQKQMEEMKLAFEKEINKLKKEMQKEIQKINIRLEKTDIKTKGRKKINKDTRQKIADKQENACGECKMTLSPYFELDHIIGLQFGGTDEESNLMALCRECHGKKSIAENQCRKRIQEAIQTILKEQTT